MTARTPDVVTVAVTRVDGGLTILRIVTTEFRPTTPEERAIGLGPRVANWTIDPTPQYVESIIAKHNWQGPLAPVSWRFVPNDFVVETTDRTYRDAWKDDGPGKGIGHDMPKVRTIHLERLRGKRDRKLEELDKTWMRATGQGKKQEADAVEAERQRLRDGPVVWQAQLAVAQTVDEVRRVGEDL